MHAENDSLFTFACIPVDRAHRQLLKRKSLSKGHSCLVVKDDKPQNDNCNKYPSNLDLESVEAANHIINCGILPINDFLQTHLLLVAYKYQY